MRKLSSSLACGATLLLSLLLTGCSGTSPEAEEKPQAAREPERQDGMTAVEIMQKMVAVYRDADSYMDNAEYAEHFILPTDGVKRQGPPTTVSVRLERPNRFLITRLRTLIDGPQQGALVASDGTHLEAIVTELEPQRLRLDAPETATLESVAPDPLLRDALFPGPIPDIFPQLALLLPDEEKESWALEAPAALVLLPPKKIKTRQQEPVECYRVQMRTTEGPQVCWIHKETFVLLRVEIANEKIQKHLYPDQEFTEFTWQFNFYDVVIDVPTTKDMFRIAPLEGEDEEIVEAFHEPAPESESVEPEGQSAANDPPVADSEPSAEETEPSAEETVPSNENPSADEPEGQEE